MHPRRADRKPGMPLQGFVNKDIAESGIYVGVPVKPLRQKDYWKSKDFVEGRSEK